MGIPSFYRWLVNRYPLCVIPAIEESSSGVIDTSTPNPNDIEFDNLYLDMNGIIHPCFHPENISPPTTYDEVFQAVFKYIDRLFSIVRPRKLLYMAIDGVAPRAKMNQQRARRFRAAKDLADQEPATKRLLNVPVTHSNEENNKLDSNIITPGTEFMELLSSALQYYIHLRMNNDPGWKGIKVIFSGACVPGEGEHKIVSFIRLQRNLPGYDPNTRHCLYGLDADLIMLALATHEVHFTILREVSQKYQPERSRSGNRKPTQGNFFADEFDKSLAEQLFQLVCIWVLRDYLAHELQIPAPNTSTDFERLIDDFVFMCIFVGNDFLPHIPSLEIGEGAIDLLMMIYKQEFVQMGHYLTMASEVNLQRVEDFIKAIGSYELPIFRKRNLIAKVRGQNSHHSSAKNNCHKTQKKEPIKAEDNLTIEKVDFGKAGWKERYYALKFEIEDKGELIRKDAVNKYVEGLCWVMHYYYQGICSWSWFYPYHYAPFASDFQGIGELEMRFDLGRPLKPFDQLMGVLPAASAQALPFFYRVLMTDSSSPILDFYPKDFEVDLNGKRHAWQGVCKLPFIDEFRLLAEVAKVEHTLTDSEVRRNTLGQDVLFIYQTHPLAKIILSFWDNAKLPDSAGRKEIIDPVLSGGMNGYIYIPEKPICPAEVDSPVGGMVIINNNKVISVFYEVPSSHPHISKLLDGLVLPGKIISKDDVHLPAILWHELTSVMGNRCHRRPKPRNCISGPGLEKMAHKLVSESCGSNDRQVVSEMWQRWLNGKGKRGNVDVGLEGKRGNGMEEGKRGDGREEGKRVKLTAVQKEKSGQNAKKEKNNDEPSKVQSSSGKSKKNDIQSPCGNGREKGKRVKLTAGQKEKRGQNAKKETNNDEPSKVQSSSGKSPSGDEREKGKRVKLTAGQKEKRGQNAKKEINNDEPSKVQSSSGKSPSGDEREKKRVKLTAGQKEKKGQNAKKEISNDEPSKVQSSSGKSPSGDEREKKRVKLTAGQKEKRGQNAIKEINNDEPSKVQSSSGKSPSGDEREKKRVKLTAGQKEKRGQNAKKETNNDEPSKVQSSSGKSPSGDEREKKRVKLTAGQKEKRGQNAKKEINNDEPSKVQSSSGKRKKNDIPSPSGDEREKGKRVKLTAGQKVKRGQNAKIERNNDEPSKVQSSSGKSKKNGNHLEVGVVDKDGGGVKLIPCEKEKSNNSS